MHGEILLKTRNGGNYKSGDIIMPLTRKRIRYAHANHQCFPRSATRAFARQDSNGLIPQGDIAQDFCESLYEYKFERLSKTEARITRLTDGQSMKVESGKHYVGFEGKTEKIDIELYVQRRLNTLKKPNGQGKPLFGSPGKEVLYGGRMNVDHTKLDAIWNSVATKEGVSESEGRFQFWPHGNVEIKNHLFVRTADFSDRDASILASPLFTFDDEKGEAKVLEKRGCCVDWKALLDEFGLSPVGDDPIIEVDIRKLKTYFIEEVVNHKGIGFMLNINTLRSEVLNDPLGRGYISMTDQEVADSLNKVKDRVINIPIPVTELVAWAGGGANDSTNTPSRVERVEEAATNSDLPPSVRGAARAAQKMFNLSDSKLDLTLSDRSQMVDALVSGGVIMSEEKDSLVSIAKKNTNRAEELGLDSVFASHVKYIRDN